MAQNIENPATRWDAGRARNWFAVAVNGFENIKNHLVIKAKNLAAVAASIDPATLAGLAFLLMGGRQ
jgi:hypothetical protein